MVPIWFGNSLVGLLTSPRFKASLPAANAGPKCTKGGMIAFTKSLAVELAPYNIAVNAVAPGFMRTPMAVINGVENRPLRIF